VPLQKSSLLKKLNSYSPVRNPWVRPIVNCRYYKKAPGFATKKNAQTLNFCSHRADRKKVLFSFIAELSEPAEFFNFIFNDFSAFSAFSAVKMGFFYELVIFNNLCRVF